MSYVYFFCKFIECFEQTLCKLLINTKPLLNLSQIKSSLFNAKILQTRNYIMFFTREYEDVGRQQKLNSLESNY